MKKLAIFNTIKKHIFLIFAAVVLSLLLLRNPYSTRNLISNLEPFPDAMFYTTTPRCFIKGRGWTMCRLHDERLQEVPTAVPPLYSSLFIPGYLINSDVRTFYFTNVILSFISLYLLYAVLKNYFTNKAVIGTILFFYVTNYFVYWLPTLAMAENVLIPVFLLSILLLQKKSFSKIDGIYAGLIAAGFYATKFSFLPLTLLYPLLFSIKLIRSDQTIKEKIYTVLLLLFFFSMVILPIFGLEEVLFFLNQYLNGALDPNSSAHIKQGGGYFSLSYIPKHFIEYSGPLIGKSQRFLWDYTPLTERWIALPALLGLLLTLRKKSVDISNIWLVAAVLAQLFFMSAFYSIDARYVYHFLPVLLIGFGFFLQHLQKTLFKNKLNFYTVLLIFFGIYSITNLLRLKSAVMVNLKYSESPWWYLAQIEMNSYFDTLPKVSDKPILITLLAPYFADNYSHNNYTPLPLSNQQDFQEYFPLVWGDGDYSNFISLYQNKLDSGLEVYITNYGINGSSYFQESYETIAQNFELIQVQSGCHNLCNIYKLESIE